MLFGGLDNKTSLYSFNSSDQQWTKVSDLPSDRRYHGSVIVGGSVFIVGGWDNNTIEQYNISTKTFKNVAIMKKCLNEFGICVFNSEALLIAGGSGNDFDATNNCFLFNTNTKTFKEISNMKTKRWGHALVNVEGIVYSIGGQKEKHKLLNTIETFDPVTEQWKTSDVMLQNARSGHQAVAHKHFIYIFGGYTYTNSWKELEVTDTIEKYNLLTGQNELLDVKLRVVRSNFAVGKVNSDFYILGGESKYLRSTDTVEIFNLETEEIRRGKNLPVSDRGFTACVF